MINIFQLADNDQAIMYLGRIFGNVGVALSGSGSAILGNMFRTFNTILLVVGSFFIVYITVVGVMTAAQEGEFMKKWNSLWTPLRMLIGIVGLFPTASGYCAIQVVIMWLIVQGVGAADMVWKTGIDFIGQGGVLSPVQADVDQGGASSTTIDYKTGIETPAAVSVPEMVKNLYGSLVCQSVLAKFNATKEGQSGDERAYGRSQVEEDRYTFGPNAVCGALPWVPDYQKRKDNEAIEKGLKNAYMTLVPALEQIADKYVNMIIADGNCWVPCSESNKAKGQCYFGKYDGFVARELLNQPTIKKPDGTEVRNPAYDCSITPHAKSAWNDLLSYTGSNFVADSIQLIAGYANNYVATQKTIDSSNQTGPQTTDLSSDIYKKAEANGWIFAGSYYYYMGVTENQNLSWVTDFYKGIKLQPVTSNDIDNNTFFGSAPQQYVLQFYCGLLKDNKCMQGFGAMGIGDAAIDAMNTAQATGGGMFVDAAGPGQGLATGILNQWMTAISGHSENPILAVQYFGKGCLIAAEVLFWIGLFAAGVTGALSANYVVLGTSVNPGSGFFWGVATYIIPIFFFFIAYLITIGAMLGVYVPLLPFTIFTFGVISWFIAVLEAMVAAPIIALGILSPGGQHEIMGKAEPAITILMNVILRPTFMVLGMFSAMLLAYAVMKLINNSFLGAVGAITGNSGSGRHGVGLIEAAIFVFAYAGLVMTALSKCFSVITVFTERALAVIGAQAHGGGEMESAEQTKGKIQAGSEAGGRVSGGVGSKLGGAASAIQTQKQREARAEKGNKNQQTSGGGFTGSSDQGGSA